MDKPYLFGRDATGNQLFPDVIVDIKSPVIFRGRQVTEHQLGCFRIRIFFPDTVHVVHTGIHLAVGIIRQHGINHSLVKGKFSPIVGNLEHVVNIRLHKPCTDFFCSFGKGSDQFRLDFTWLGLDVVVLDRRNRELQHIGGLNIRHLPEHQHQLRQVEKLGKAGFRPVIGSLRSQLQSGDCLTKGGCPAVKMLQSIP